jgi:TatD DNase family protein
MIDTHSHIYLPDFDEDRRDVILRAKEAGVTHIILPNVDRETIPAMLDLEAQEPSFFHAAIGLHPTSVNANFFKELELVKQELNRRPYCAIGEIGIDLYWDKTFFKQQQAAFEQQLEWAIEYELPVIIHVRDAFTETLDIVERNNCDKLRGVFHSFGGSEADAKRIMDLEGFMLGINGVVTFKNSGLSKVLESVPLDYIVLETDAPYLTPAPHRGKRNEPYYLSLIMNKLVEVYCESYISIEIKTDKNALNVFKKIKF